jgi:hypothetical protein
MRSSKGLIEEFKRSSIWLDICDELDIRIEKRRYELENPDLLLNQRSLDQMSGGVKAYREVKSILETLIDLIQDQDEDEGGRNE